MATSPNAPIRASPASSPSATICDLCLTIRTRTASRITSTWSTTIVPGFLPDGTVDTAGIAKGGSIPPINLRTIGEALNEKNISWAYYGGAYNAAVQLQHNPASTIRRFWWVPPTATSATSNPIRTRSWAIPMQRAAHIKDATDFFAAIDNG